MKKYYLYHNSKQVNSIPMTKSDVDTVMKHKTITLVEGRRGKTIPTTEIKVVERLVF